MRSLTLARVATLGPVVAAFPVATAAVFALGADRDATADALAVVYAVGIFAAFTTALWPLPALRGWSRERRLASLCLFFLTVSYATHLSWELVWLVAHDAIAAARDSAWAYPWWAYIDGGDARYAAAPTELLVLESISVANGTMGAIGLVLWHRSRGTSRAAPRIFMASAVVHLATTLYYFGGEVAAGLPNVDTTSFLDTWIKFALANAPWLIFPWAVLVWAWRRGG